jgi:hypothetical protein
LAQAEPNYFAHAFKSQYNLIGLGTALGFAVLSGSALPLILAAGIELAVLPLVAGSAAFQRLVRSRQQSEESARTVERRRAETAELLRSLPPVELQRFKALEAQAVEIRKNYAGLDESSRFLVEELEDKLDFLLGFYLRMRHALARYERYFATTDPERIQERIAMMEHEIRGGPERLREIKARTRDVLAKRLERWQKAQENRQLMDAQTETVHEVLQLLRDQSFTMRDPSGITAQLDGLVSAAEETERGVREMEALFGSDEDVAIAGSFAADVDAELHALSTGLGPGLREAAPAPRVPASPARQPHSPPPPPPRQRSRR